MKNALHKCIALLTLAFIITSCSQTQDIAKTNDGPQYRYKKVYVGNKIVYRDVDEKDDATTEASEKLVVTEEVEPIAVPEEAEEMPVTASAENADEEKSFGSEVSQTFMSNLKEVRHTVATGSFLTQLSKQKRSEKIRVSKAAEEDDKTMIGAYEIFALIGFAFGLASVFGGLILAILGAVFSILGLNSGYRIFAIIGLICAVVGFILALI